jgi:hypothetical protein
MKNVFFSRQKTKVFKWFKLLHHTMLLDIEYLSHCDAIAALDESAAAALIEECEGLANGSIDVVTATPRQTRKRRVSLQMPIEVVDKKKKKRTQQQRTASRKEKAAR